MRRLANVIVLLGLLSLATGNAIFSEEDTDTVLEYDVVVPEGRRLVLKVYNLDDHNVHSPRWQYNGQPLVDRRCQIKYSELECPTMTRQDAGQYEMWATDRSGYPRLILSANVRILREDYHVRQLPPAHVRRYPSESYIIQVEKDVESVTPISFPESDDCFCSGITTRCHLATGLFWRRISFSLVHAEPVNHYLSTNERAALPGLAVPGIVWGNNLLMAYGGYLQLPVTSECRSDSSQPCVVLIDRQSVAIGYFLPDGFDERTLNVPMRESSWRLLDAGSDGLRMGSPDKFSFMTVLSKVRQVYVRGRYEAQEDPRLTIDIASPNNTGLGRVSTVEKCFCHPGYVGFSCERCDTGYARLTETINSNGVCISNRELWDYYKRKYMLPGRSEPKPY